MPDLVIVAARKSLDLVDQRVALHTTGFSIFKARKNVMGNVKIKYQVLNVVLARAKLQVSLTV